MRKDANDKTYAFWNGKNLNGASVVGKDDLLPETRNSKTLAKYVVGNETVSADNLQDETSTIE